MSLESGPSPGDLELLDRFRPCLRYDSQAMFKALSVDSMLDNPGNDLRRGKSVQAAAGQDAQFDLAFLAQAKSRRWDRLHQASQVAEDALDLQAKRKYADAVHGAVRRRGQRCFLQYWVWFYAVGPFPSARRSRCAWRLIQVELDSAGQPTHVVAGQRANLVAGGRPYERRTWESADKRRLGPDWHPIVYVDPRLQCLSLQRGPHGSRVGLYASDGGGDLVVTKVVPCDGWERWRGRWGSVRGAPRSPGRTWQWRRPHRVGRGVGGVLEEGFMAPRRLFARGRRADVPELTARLEPRRVVVHWRRHDEREAVLFLTVRVDGVAVAARYALADEEAGEEVIALPPTLQSCELRASANLSFRRTPCKPQTLTLNNPDALERKILREVIGKQLRSTEINRFARRLDVRRDALRDRLDNDDERIWRNVASELQSFRDARSTNSLRRLGEARRRRARRSFMALGAVTGAVTVGVTVLALLSNDPDLTLLSVYVGGMTIYMCVLLGLSRWQRWRMVRSEVTGTAAAGDDGSFQTARDAFERALREKAVAPLIREEINASTRDKYDDPLDFGDEGLPELRAFDHEIPTGSSERLTDLAERMRGGSIGIAGPRGAGKTTLINEFCTPKTADDRRLTTIIAAPARYDARDFVLTLFARLCDSVLAGERSPVAQGVPRLFVRLAPLAPLLPAAVIVAFLTWRSFAWDAAWPIFGALALLGAAVVTVGGDLMRGRQPRSYRLLGGSAVLAAGLVLVAAAHTHWYDRYWLGDWAALAAAAVTYALGLWRRPPPAARRLVECEDMLVSQASEHLRDIRFQQSYSTGYSGKLSLPAGAELGMERREELAQRQASFPEIIERLREFIALAVRARGGVAIGIDEMDKMESADVAQQFLNEIKGIFGVERCFYLVSISENAMASFERRGLPFRDVFDSSFDEVVSVGPLTLEQSKLLLHGRVLGLGPAYLDLCHCLGGGLPRDVLRVARQLSLHNPRRRQKAPPLEKVVAKIVAAELSRKISAISVSAHRITLEPHVSELLRWINRLPPLVRPLARGATDASGLIGWCRSTPDHWPRDELQEAEDNAAARTLERLRLELATFAYFVATVLEMFVRPDGDPASRIRQAELGDRRRQPAFDRLAAARTAFSVNPLLAVEIVNGVRRPEWGIVPFETAVARRRAASTAVAEPEAVGRGNGHHELAASPS